MRNICNYTALVRPIVLIPLIALTLAGCAAPHTEPEAQPTATVACPAPAEGPAPTSCIPYDPDAAMAQNEHYRDRKDLTDGQLSESAEPVATAMAALQPFTNGTAAVTEAAIVAAFVGAGFDRDSIQTVFADQSDGPSVAFGIEADFGGCIFGGVSATESAVHAGGFILDGGCLALSGH